MKVTVSSTQKQGVKPKFEHSKLYREIDDPSRIVFYCEDADALITLAPTSAFGYLEENESRRDFILFEGKLTIEQ